MSPLLGIGHSLVAVPLFSDIYKIARYVNYVTVISKECYSLEGVHPAIASNLDVSHNTWV